MRRTRKEGKGRRSLRVVVLIVGLAAALNVLSAAAALADAGANASCMGFEASGISPAGSSEEFPGGVPQLNEFISEAFPGVPPGAIKSFIATLHEGSHEACDAALD